MRIRTAVIGTGFIGRVHLEALRRVEYVDVVEIAATSLDKARAELDQAVLVDGPLQRFHQRNVAARFLQAPQTVLEARGLVLRQIRTQPGNDALHFIHEPGDLDGGGVRQLAVPGHALGAALIEGNIHKSERDSN